MLEQFFLFHLCSKIWGGKKKTLRIPDHRLIHVRNVCVSINFFANSKVWSTWGHTCRTCCKFAAYGKAVPSLLSPVPPVHLSREVLVRVYDGTGDTCLIGWMFYSVQCSDWYQAIDFKQSVSNRWNWRTFVENAHRISFRFPLPHSSLHSHAPLCRTALQLTYCLDQPKFFSGELLSLVRSWFHPVKTTGCFLTQSVWL